MSFQAYLDNIQAKTGKTANQLVALAKKKGFDKPDIKAGVILAWLKEDFNLGRGHGMAMVHVIKRGAVIPTAHIGGKGPHRDPSEKLNLNGIKPKKKPTN